MNNSNSCSSCGQPLTVSDFNTTHFVYLCLDWHCPLHHHPQDTREKTLAEMQSAEEKGAIRTIKPGQIDTKRYLRPSYGTYLETRRINYHHLRDLGVPSKEAANSTSNKRTKKIERLARKKAFTN